MVVSEIRIATTKKTMHVPGGIVDVGDLGTGVGDLLRGLGALGLERRAGVGELGGAVVELALLLAQGRAGVRDLGERLRAVGVERGLRIGELGAGGRDLRAAGLELRPCREELVALAGEVGELGLEPGLRLGELGDPVVDGLVRRVGGLLLRLGGRSLLRLGRELLLRGLELGQLLLELRDLGLRLLELLLRCGRVHLLELLEGSGRLCDARLERRDVVVDVLVVGDLGAALGELLCNFVCGRLLGLRDGGRARLVGAGGRDALVELPDAVLDLPDAVLNLSDTVLDLRLVGVDLDGLLVELSQAGADLRLRVVHLAHGESLLERELLLAVLELGAAVVELGLGIVDLALAIGELSVRLVLGVVDGRVRVGADRLAAGALALLASVVDALLYIADQAFVLVGVAQRHLGALDAEVGHGIDVGLHVVLRDKEGVLRAAARAERHCALARVDVLRVEHDGADPVFLAREDGLRLGVGGVVVEVNGELIGAGVGSGRVLLGVVAFLAALRIGVRGAAEGHGIPHPHARLRGIAPGHGHLVCARG